ncbi:FAD binding domain protein [Sclerotinia borealis F-4128]|uniref:FAD binding domain protein n=1 Tax=Sclerotinia borealis (strain F-4128) TaxID=1432307 RepID=W9C3K4_SCLBF|nr:FAD binding domain protein [Sclerotinia borealis F-4128]
MKTSSSLVVAVAILCSVISAQSIVTSTLSPATTTVVSFSTPSLFSSEVVQLTEGVLDTVASSISNASISDLFAFGTDADADADAAVAKRTTRACKLLPGDALWPITLIWDILDILLGGSLIKTTPLAAVCYPDWPEYDVTKCASITADWYFSELHEADPTSIQLPLYQGRSCMPPGFNYTNTCEQGGYPTYAVNVSNVAQIQLAVNFARNLDLHLVIKNTGHDFNGKASGKGGLTVWTHYLTDKAYYPKFAATNGYTGPAIKVGSGILVHQAYEYAKSLGGTVIGGEALAVGMGGGYIAGGGHSPLSSLYGMGADQVLAMEVVLASGKFITCDSKTNSDVFWMLRGGGGSTIGVVTSLTVKLLPKLETTTVTFNFTLADTPGTDAFWGGVQAYIDNAQTFVDAGSYGYYYLGASAAEIGTDYAGSTDYYFRMESFVAPNMTVVETQTLLKPWFDVLENLNITYTPWYNHADNFHDAWAPSFPEEYVGTDVVKTASRLMPRSVFIDDDLRNQTFAAHRAAVEQGFFIAGFHVSGTGIAVDPPTDSAVLPAWRSTTMHVIVGVEFTASSTWAEIETASNSVTSYMDVFRNIAPDSGAYMSEADLIEPNQTVAFYGVNYDKLYAMKQEYDPTGMFFALTAIGSVDWEIQTTDDLPYSWNTNGRRCPV